MLIFFFPVFYISYCFTYAICLLLNLYALFNYLLPISVHSQINHCYHCQRKKNIKTCVQASCPFYMHVLGGNGDCFSLLLNRVFVAVFKQYTWLFNIVKGEERLKELPARTHISILSVYLIQLPGSHFYDS